MNPPGGWLDPLPWAACCEQADADSVRFALNSPQPGLREFARLLSPAADAELEAMATRAQAITRRHFGRVISLYVPLYLSNYCSGGCVYCGFAADREQPRRRLEPDELEIECRALKERGFEDVLLLTGERCPQADVDYLRESVRAAARHFHNVTVETFAMTTDEYRSLAAAGCTGVTLYQETYDPALYSRLHRWGPKRDFRFRLEAPERALEAGMRTVGIGALLGLDEPRREAIALLQHAWHLRRRFWRAGVLISFPRLCGAQGHYQPPCPVGDRLLAQIIFAFRIVLPDVPLVLSTREAPAFRDGVAGVGISRMSAASRTTVGGYHDPTRAEAGQFDVSDTRDAETFCGALRAKGLEPVFKNWEAVYRG